MCMGSCWYPLAYAVVCFAGMLLATERALLRGRWLMLALMVALVGMINPFFLYLTAALLLFYVPSRLFDQYGWEARLFLRARLTLTDAAVLCVALGALIS